MHIQTAPRARQDSASARPRPKRRTPRTRRGAAAALAMIYLVLFSTLALGMFAMSTLNVQTATNHRDVERARAAAEAGLRFVEYRFSKMPRPKTTTGQITAAVANSLWPEIIDSIDDDLATLVDANEKATTFANNTLTSAPIDIGNDSGRFRLDITQDPLDQRYLLVHSTGTARNASRTVSMRFLIDKKVKFAVVGKVPIQLGRNTLTEGPVAMATAAKYPPIFMLSDFRHLNSSLASRIDAFNNFLKARHNGFDNRVNVKNQSEYAQAVSNGFTDYTGDGFVDEYDLFVYEFDRNGDRAITSAEFTNPVNGKLYDAELFGAIDSLGAPMFAGDPTRVGYQDGKIDAADGYAKIRGQISLATSQSAWTSNLSSSGQRIQDQIKGPITTPSAATPPVRFGVSPNEIFDLSPQNFDTTTFKARTGSSAGTAVRTVGRIENTTLLAGDANGGTADERTPHGSASYQATYRRPVFRNMAFKNVRIPKGLNALFDNCTFEGTTFVELDPNITTSTGQLTASSSEGMRFAQRMKSGSFSSTTALTAANSYGFEKGNNLRFNNCTMKGPLASDVPTAYTHFANSMEFTGATMFDNQVDSTATLVCPQTNIEMGSFTDPALAPSTLVGVVVAGNLDIRGTSRVDGSIIITGDGAGSTTLGWFGASDASTETTTPMPEGGWGKINIRYNPSRVLPDGINLAIDITADPSSYSEVQ